MSSTTTMELGAWFDGRDEDEDYKTRVHAALSTLKRRLIQHNN